MQSKTETCCSEPLASRDGFLVCLHCGKMFRPHLDTHMTSYNQCFGYIKSGYSRKNRFEKKLIASLRCLAHYNIDTELVKHLKKLKIETPEQLLVGIAQYPKKKPRKPYMYATYYWVALGKSIPCMTENDIRMLDHSFDQIFFAWRRLRVSGPHFPYAYLMRKIVSDSDEFSDNIRYLMRFLRVLRCRSRRLRYDKLFETCKNLDLKNATYNIINESNCGSEDEYSMRAQQCRTIHRWKAETDTTYFGSI